MTLYKKFFDKSEVEYIAPFLKLWMSFNNWYKEDLDDVDKDRKAIDIYKKGGKIKEEFLKLFDDSSEIGIEFNISLYELVLNIKEGKDNPLVNMKGKAIEYDRNLICENNRDNENKADLTLIYISETRRRYQIPFNKKDNFFENTLEIIYQVRCSLVHGSFDIDNLYFMKLVENSYRVLYPIMNNILENEQSEEFICKSRRKNVYARAKFNKGNMTVLVDSKISKDVASSYSSSIEIRERRIAECCEEEEDYYLVTRNMKFNSPSAAASFCLGNSSNGWDEWKNRSGETLNDKIRVKNQNGQS